MSLKAVDSARRAQKPAKLSGVMLASAPPAITTSAWPARMSASPCPMAWALEEQAVDVVRFGPLAPNAMATAPDAELSVIIGMRFGCTRPGRLVR